MTLEQMQDTQVEDFARWLPAIVAVKTYDEFPPELWLGREERQVQPLEYLGLCHLVEAKLSQQHRVDFINALRFLIGKETKHAVSDLQLVSATFDQRHAALKEVMG